MISVVICSIDRGKFERVSAMYRQLIPQVEIVGIHDARSLAEGYNRGIAQSTGEFLILSHDDIHIINPDFHARILTHLNQFDLIGVAGTTKLVGPGWMGAALPYIFGQVVHPDPRFKYRLDVYGVPSPVVGGIQAIDGLLMAMRRTVAEKVPFDAVTFDGFHLYDIDFSFSAYLAGFRLAVACDIWVIHESAGSFNQKWEEYALRFYNKRQQRLAPFVNRTFQHGFVSVEDVRQLPALMTPPNWTVSFAGKAPGNARA